ncbi:MAG: RNA-directed DNA polymerase [Bacilli bacterium]|nr:RNA-directed DNA polymerase [Bacilli bacterium]
MLVNIKDLAIVYDEEIRKNVKNKRKIFAFEKNKFQYLVSIKRVLENGEYDGGKYNIFIVYKPKIRVVMSQSIYDKIINHYVTRFILMPKLNKYLNHNNCATRKNMGTSYAIRLLKKYIEYYKKHFSTFYYLKMDIKKYFYSIDHQTLLAFLQKDLSNEELLLMKTILNSTNKSYINKTINSYSDKVKMQLPLYEYGKGLPIGNMSSQFLAVFYMHKLHHYMEANLHIKFVCYMDDFIILNENKDKLKEYQEFISKVLLDEYKLFINTKKTYIANIKEGLPFLGHIFKIKNNKTVMRLSQNSKKNIKKGIKSSKYYYAKGIIKFSQLFSSIETYMHSYIFVHDNTVKNIVNKYWY